MPAQGASPARSGREPLARPLSEPLNPFGTGEATTAKHVVPGTLLGVRSSNEIDAPEPPHAPSGDAAAEALAEARARVGRDGRRGGAYAAQRPPNEPLIKSEGDANRDVRNQGAEVVTVQPAKPAADPRSATRPYDPRNPGPGNPLQPAASSREPQVSRADDPKRGLTPTKVDDPPVKPAGQNAEYQKAHLKELMQRRHGAAPAEPAVAKRDPVRELRSAQESLRDGQYARAEEQLRALSEISPSDTVRTYWMWAQLRAGQGLDPGQLAGLRDLAKKLIAEPEHAGFACYVLGHLYLGEKKDDQAEKYFRKAHALDKSNKDAERHLVILERRKQQATEAEAPGQRKIFGISLNKPKGS